MVYTTPFAATMKALYGALNKNADVGVEWFDSAVPMNEITDHFKSQERFEYGIFGEMDADCSDNKDTALWTVSINLEIYSNYRGRKNISSILENLLNYLSTKGKGWDALAKIYAENGFNLVAITVGALHINLPIYSDIGTWQSGETKVQFTLSQK
ncbi:hypothetical protein [Dialister succinatiphilus]|uniref:Uncharacterized protein n=1 Tax=Dialister succinatiphilus YIT 11850 TaxID=742743 RepID=H1CYX1_9FIRM|nr:hypothetical protein [Dialister succinatiphilus]EHO63542.1 hypothetical protein HMPREF9453_00559 [Dialister succinatiphilus YIT 11850]